MKHNYIEIFLTTSRLEEKLNSTKNLIESDLIHHLWHFLRILSPVNKNILNDSLNENFGRMKSLKSITNAMYDFVKYNLRVNDLLDGENGADYDMMLHFILNNSGFFEEFIFKVNNNSLT